MNKINKVIEESNKEFERVFIKGFCGNCNDIKCINHASLAIQSFISQRDQKILSAIEEEVERKKMPHKCHFLHTFTFIEKDNNKKYRICAECSKMGGHNYALTDIQSLLKSAKEEIK